LAHGIADTAVTMACKSHWRNDRPVLIGLSTNDGLAGSAANIGRLMAKKNTFFIPYAQDDAQGKPSSLVYVADAVRQAALSALEGRQMQPMLSA
jgi:dipicolinate synthase subunit B